MSSRAALLLVLPAALCACQDTQARQHSAELEKRVAALEAEVTALKAAKPNAFTVTDVADVATRAAAQNCAVELARTLEAYRQDSLERRYPSRTELEVPEACRNQNVRWQALQNQAFHFQVLGKDGRPLAQQQEP